MNATCAVYMSSEERIGGWSLVPLFSSVSRSGGRPNGIQLLKWERKSAQRNIYSYRDHSCFYSNNSEIMETMSQRYRLETGDTFLTFANDQSTLVCWYCIGHLLQSSRTPHVAVTSSPATHYAPKTVSLLCERQETWSNALQFISNENLNSLNTFLKF